MILNLKRYISLLLVLMLLIGIVPTVNAAELDSERTLPEETVSEASEQTGQTDPTEPTEPTAPPGDTGDADLVDPGTASEVGDYAVMSIASTQNSIMLFDYADNGNYTTVLNSQVSCAYKPNGSGTIRTAYIKNMGWHFARYGGVAYPDDPLYCIEPWRSYAASTSGNSVDRDVTLDGSGSTQGSNVWHALPAERREAIGLILLYSNQMWDHSISVTTTSKANNPNVPLRVATQFLIYEIVCGLRDPSTFTLNSTNECGTAGDIFYNAGIASVPNFAPNYNSLVSNIQAAKKIPSFTSSSSGSAPTITLTGKETAATDANGVLANWSFTDGNGAAFYKSGNTLYITQTGTISESTVFKATRYLPSASSSSYNLWYMSGSSYQTTISLYNASSGNLNAYFKLRAPDPGAISLTKTTEDGKNLSGWRFGIYSDSACTSLVSGPHITDSSGKISVTGLSAGTYYVKELGHTDSSINALYSCSSTNPQKVTVTSGGTAAVSFVNKLKTGPVSLTKTTEDAAFGTDIVVQDFTNVMRNVRSRRIDTTKYVDCGTKNNLDLVQWAISAYQSRWGYVMGTFGQVLTVDLLEAKLQQLPDAIGPYEDYIRANYLGVRTADCIGLIKGYSWYDPESGNINYGSNGMPDVSADQIYAQAAEKGSMVTMPEIPGILVHAPGHIGIYIGNGYAIEAMGTRYGVVKTAVASRNWTGWCKNPYINYIEETEEDT